jgi:hypothetical protein
MAWWYNLGMQKPQKEPLQRKEEPLEVGLARYQKNVRRVPPWLIEYGAWIVLASFLLFVVVPLLLLGKEIGSSGAHGSDFARLKVIEVPTKIWVEGISHQLRSVQVVVANTGPSAAKSVKVSVEIVGTKYPLSGPVEIAPGKVERYAGGEGAILRPEQELALLTECSNCRQD